jgi:small-conductance mechanosensitive channel
MLQTWSDVLAYTFQELWAGVIMFLPKLIIALIIFIVGWVIAVALGKLVNQVVRAIRVDKLFQALGAEEPLARAGFRLDSGAFVGGLVRWFLIIVFLIAALDIMGLGQVNLFLREVVLGYLPNVIVAALILIVAAFVADATQKLVVGSAKAAGVPSSHLLGGVTRWSIWTFAILAALYQLGIAGVFAQTLFTGLVAMLAIAGGVAFGLGGKEAAGRFVERMRKDIGGKE